LIISIINAIVEPLYITDLPASPTSYIIGNVFHIIYSIIPLILNLIFLPLKVIVDVLWNILNLSDLTASPPRCVIWEVFDILTSVVKMAFGTILVVVDTVLKVVFVFVPVLLCLGGIRLYSILL
jgi:hypothetical protein